MRACVSLALRSASSSARRSLHTASPAAQLASRRFSPPPRVPLTPLRAMQTSTIPPVPQKEKEDKSASSKFLLSATDAKILQSMLDDLGVSTPSQLRRFIAKKSLPVLALTLFDTARSP